MKFSRRNYLVVCFFGGLLLAVVTGVYEDPRTGVSEMPLYLTGAKLLVWLLTHPAGILAQAVSIPLTYTGIATQSEAFILSLPIAVALGYIQWYVIVPKYLRREQKWQPAPASGRG